MTPGFYCLRWLAPLRTAAVTASLLLLAATLHAQAKAKVEKRVALCSPQGCRIPIYVAPSIVQVPYYVRIENMATQPLTFRLIDDVPVKALGFRVIDRGDGQPCGASGNPTCSNQPAPAGANGTGQVVVDGILLGAKGTSLSTTVITFEVDFSCPPIVRGDLIPNQAKVYTPLNPAVCYPCLSDDPNTGTPDDPTLFMGWCLPAPEFTITKTPSVLEWSPGQSTAIDFHIEVTNRSATETLFGSDLLVLEYLPRQADLSPAYDTGLTCPLRVTTTPPAGLTITDEFCDDPRPYANIQRNADVPPLGSFSLDLETVMLDRFTDGFEYCNDAVAYYGVTGATASTRACTTVRVPQDVDFRGSVKTVTPAIATPGDVITYQIAVLNSGSSTATGVVLTDVFPVCVDDAAFDPVLNVNLASGPPRAPITYARTLRTLTVPLPDLPPGGTDTVYIGALFAEDPVCCNQASLTSNEVRAPGHKTGGPGGPGEQSCYGPRGVNFTQSTKTVTPGSLKVGDDLVYTITIVNTGGSVAHDLVLTDVFPDCIDDSGFDPLTDITVGPGRADSIVYQPAGRLLTMRFASMSPAAPQVITVRGLRGGAASGACCNQAFIASAEVPPLGDPTGQTAGAGDPTCAEILPAVASCDLNRDLATAATDLAALYTTACAAGDQRLAGSAGQVPDVMTGQLVDTVAAVPGFELTLYQLDCSCTSAIHLTKDAGPPASVKITF